MTFFYYDVLTPVYEAAHESFNCSEFGWCQKIIQKAE